MCPSSDWSASDDGFWPILSNWFPLKYSHCTLSCTKKIGDSTCMLSHLGHPRFQCKTIEQRHNNIQLNLCYEKLRKPSQYFNAYILYMCATLKRWEWTLNVHYYISIFSLSWITSANNYSLYHTFRGDATEERWNKSFLLNGLVNFHHTFRKHSLQTLYIP